MEKENLKTTYEYFDDLRLYQTIIQKYNPDNVLLYPFFAENEEELRNKAFGVIAEYEREDIEDVIADYQQNLKFQWEGTGYYDIQGIVEGIKNGVVVRIEVIMDIEVYDIDIKNLFHPELIEEEFGGKVYGVFGCNTGKFPTEYKTKFIIVYDLKNESNTIGDPFSILEDYGIKPHAYGVSCNTNKWYNYEWQRVVDLNSDRLLNFLIELDDNIEIIYLSKFN